MNSTVDTSATKERRVGGIYDSIYGKFGDITANQANAIVVKGMGGCRRVGATGRIEFIQFVEKVESRNISGSNRGHFDMIYMTIVRDSPDDLAKHSFNKWGWLLGLSL